MDMNLESISSASKEVNVKHVDEKKEIDSDCPICLESLVNENNNRSLVKLTCGHQFHLDCIGSAFNAKQKMQCPICRNIEQGQWLYASGLSNTDFSFHDFTHGTEEDYLPSFMDFGQPVFPSSQGQYGTIPSSPDVAQLADYERFMLPMMNGGNIRSNNDGIESGGGGQSGNNGGNIGNRSDGGRIYPDSAWTPLGPHLPSFAGYGSNNDSSIYPFSFSFIPPGPDLPSSADNEHFLYHMMMNGRARRTINSGRNRGGRGNGGRSRNSRVLHEYQLHRPL